MIGRAADTDAVRSRRYRARQRRGIRVYPVPVIEFATVAALIDRGHLSETDSRDPTKVAQALARLVAGWAASPQRF